MTTQDVISNFIDKKNADSPYLTLLDGESVRVKSVDQIKMVTKVGYGGEEVECLRLVCTVETEYGDKKKNFDNSSAKFAKELEKHSIVVGAAFTLTREGESTKTTYNISDVVLPASTAGAPAQQAAQPVQPMTEQQAADFIAS